MRARDRIRFPGRPGETGVSYFFEHLDFPVAGRRLEAFYAEFQPVEPGAVPPHAKPGIELESSAVFGTATPLRTRTADYQLLRGQGAAPKRTAQTGGSGNPAHVSNRLNDELRLIVLDEVSTLFSEPKLPMR